MNKLWAPWRAKYITSKKKSKKCIFCLSKNRNSDKKHLVVLRGTSSFSILNIFPYNNGHFMVCPVRHIKNIEDLSEKEINDIFDVLKKTKKIVSKILRPQGYNIGINIGRVGGAGLENHLHIHVVPRWNGDTNFMPVAAETKVISQSLKELHAKLTK